MADAHDDVTRDAVLVLPGIMGSELVDTSTGDTVWGLADLGWYVSAWTTGHAMTALSLTDAERDGRVGRIRPTRLLRFPAVAPFLRGVEPYTNLLRGLRQVVPDEAAIAEFPYDWRLSVVDNARLLAVAAERHLAAWRAHHQGSADARLVLVAHSMGGLIARYFTTVLGGSAEVRATVTLGTPFHGAVKAAVILSSGRGAPVPLPHRRLRALSATLPGVHDLLPTYRCVDEGASARRLTPADVAAFGGDAELARESFASRERLLAGDTHTSHAMVGVEQRTLQSVLLRDGTVDGRYYTCEPRDDGTLARVDRFGDATVYRDAAAVGGSPPSVLPQCHGAIARTAEAIAFVRAMLTGRPLGPPLAGTGAPAIEVPDVVVAGEPFDVTVTNSDDPTGIGCLVEHAGTRAPVAHPDLRRRDGELVARVVLARPGVYRVQAKRGGVSAVSDLVMAITHD